MPALPHLHTLPPKHIQLFRGGILGDKVVSIHDGTSQRWLQGSNNETPPAQIGRLVIPQVSGIGFYTATQRGTTSRRGEFTYLPGECVTFFIGAAEFPSATASAAMTPYDFGTAQHEKVNLVRLLYSVCEEKNGTLFVPPSLTRMVTAPIDFAAAPDVFAHQSGVVLLVEYLNCELLDERVAVDRLDANIARYVFATYLDVALTLWFSAPPSSDYTLSLNGKNKEP
jgi:hypothetical protein